MLLKRNLYTNWVENGLPKKGNEKPWKIKLKPPKKHTNIGQQLEKTLSLELAREKGRVSPNPAVFDRGCHQGPEWKVD